jgi:hypothetical protein
MSTNTGTPPRKTKALAVETNVKLGIMTSSPGAISSSNAVISSAAVQEGVSRALPPPEASARRETALSVL